MGMSSSSRKNAACSSKNAVMTKSQRPDVIFGVPDGLENKTSYGHQLGLSAFQSTLPSPNIYIYIYSKNIYFKV